LALGGALGVGGGGIRNRLNLWDKGR
jgi:hypothetical protein